jgi:hypothetical protein
MNFSSVFNDWLNLALSSPIPDEVQAFSFNLFEPAFVDDTKFGVELVGAGAYTPENTDWACDEIWEAKPRQLNIPRYISGDEWEACLALIKKQVQTLLSSDGSISTALKSRQAVALGFVDGDLDVLWSFYP